MSPVNEQTQNKTSRFSKLKDISAVGVILAGVFLAGTVFAISFLSADSATFRSSISADRPIKQHLLNVEGSGQLIANLSDRTGGDDDKVRYTLTLLDKHGEQLQQVMSTDFGGAIQVVETVEPGVYTFTVSTLDTLTESGADYTLEIQYPNETAELNDVTAPTISISSPQIREEVSGTVSITGTATDDSQISQVALSMDDTGVWIVADGTENWSLEFDTTKISDGDHTLLVRATDAAGNQAEESIPVFVFNGDDPGDTGSGDDSGNEEGSDGSTGGGNDDNTGGGNDGNTDGSDEGASDDNEFSDNFVNANWQSRYDFAVWHRDDSVVSQTEWSGDHQSTGDGDLCNSPDNKRTIQRGERSAGFNDDWIYRCAPGGDTAKAHLMTSIGDTSGYSIGSFAPKETFNGIREVRWDVNQTDLGDRQWTEVAIIPVDNYDTQNLPCAVGLPCGNHTHATAGSVGTQWGGNRARAIITPEMPGGYTQAGGSLGYRCDGCPYSPAQRFGEAYGANDPALTSIVIRRGNFFRDNGNGTLTWGFELENGTFNEFIVPGSFPEGDVRVVFKDHNYTPLKSPATLLPETTFTWHWDDISIK